MPKKKDKGQSKKPPAPVTPKQPTEQRAPDRDAKPETPTVPGEKSPSSEASGGKTEPAATTSLSGFAQQAPPKWQDWLLVVGLLLTIVYILLFRPQDEYGPLQCIVFFFVLAFLASLRFARYVDAKFQLDKGAIKFQAGGVLAACIGLPLFFNWVIQPKSHQIDVKHASFEQWSKDLGVKDGLLWSASRERASVAEFKAFLDNVVQGRWADAEKQITGKLKQTASDETRLHRLFRMTQTQSIGFVLPESADTNVEHIFADLTYSDRLPRLPNYERITRTATLNEVLDKTNFDSLAQEIATEISTAFETDGGDALVENVKKELSKRTLADLVRQPQIVDLIAIALDLKLRQTQDQPSGNGPPYTRRAIVDVTMLKGADGKWRCADYSAVMSSPL